MWLPNRGLSTGENLGPQTRLHVSVLNLLAFWAAFLSRPGRGEGWGSSHWRRKAAVVLHSDRKALPAQEAGLPPRWGRLWVAVQETVQGGSGGLLCSCCGLPPETGPSQSAGGQGGQAHQCQSVHVGEEALPAPLEGTIDLLEASRVRHNP